MGRNFIHFGKLLLDGAMSPRIRGCPHVLLENAPMHRCASADLTVAERQYRSASKMERSEAGNVMNVLRNIRIFFCPLQGMLLKYQDVVVFQDRRLRRKSVS